MADRRQKRPAMRMSARSLRGPWAPRRLGVELLLVHPIALTEAASGKMRTAGDERRRSKYRAAYEGNPRMNRTISREYQETTMKWLGLQSWANASPDSLSSGFPQEWPRKPKIHPRPTFRNPE
jgi:hypothetical protein